MWTGFYLYATGTCFKETEGYLNEKDGRSLVFLT